MRAAWLTAKDEGENNANDDFPDRILSFHRESFIGRECRLDVQAGLPSLRIFDNDNETRNSDQAQVDERTTAMVFHTLQIFSLKDEDDDCTSFATLDEGDEDSLLRRTKNRPL
jgi:hypothetical protein